MKRKRMDGEMSRWSEAVLLPGPGFNSPHHVRLLLTACASRVLEICQTLASGTHVCTHSDVLKKQPQKGSVYSGLEDGANWNPQHSHRDTREAGLACAVAQGRPP